MPIAMSGSWPGHRQLWRVIRREGGRTLLVTHGLSDPFIERLEPSVGLGLELALERVAVLLGVESRTLPRHFSTPYGAVRLVTVKALLPSELAYLLAHDAEGQAELARRFAESGEEHLSRLKRKPVV